MVAEYRDGSLGQQEFATSKGINLFTLRYWINKSRQRADKGTGFIQLDKAVGADICLRYPNGVELLLPAHTPLEVLQGLVKF